MEIIIGNRHFGRCISKKPKHSVQSVLVVGNSAFWKNWQKDDPLGLALYSRVLTDLEGRHNYFSWAKKNCQTLKTGSGLIGFYPFKEGKGEWARNMASEAHSLYLSTVFHTLQKIVLQWPAKVKFGRWSFYQAIAVNILGFIPLGFFLTIWLLSFTRLPTVGAGSLTLLFGAFTSLGIELAQVYLPTRSSSVIDLVFNTLGTLIGIVLLRIVERRLEVSVFI